MRDILADVERWLAEGKRIALATVVQTWGSSPRRAGSKMAVASDGQFTGSVSGGCVENAVIEAALDVLKTAGLFDAAATSRREKNEAGDLLRSPASSKD